MTETRTREPLRTLPIFRLLLVCGSVLLLPELAAAQPVLTRVNLGPAGVQANNFSWDTTISADGRWVAFMSVATNLVSGDTNGIRDIFVRDRWTGTTTRVSVGPGGTQAIGVDPVNGSNDPAISAHGRWVAFHSTATNLVASDTNDTHDVFVHDRQTGITTRVSVGPGGVEGNNSGSSGGSLFPAISADGRFVAFHSYASNLVAGDTNNQSDVFVHDPQTGTTTRVSVGPGGVQGNSHSFRPAISADGRWVAFQSNASNLVAGDTNGTTDIFVHDRQTATTTRVSVGSSGQADFSSSDAAVSADGRFVAFTSAATNLVLGDTNNHQDAFVHDRQTGVTTRVSVGPGGAEGDSDSESPSLSADGRFVAFASWATSLVAGDTNNQQDVFVHDRQTGTTRRVSVGPAGVQGNQFSRWPAISNDGRWVAFESAASSLVVGDTNNREDVFIVDRRVHGDVDFDGRADPTIYRPSSGVWYVLESGSQYATGSALAWGVSTDLPVAGDYDGDGRMDMSVYRPATGEWYVLLSGAQFTTWMSFVWGVSTDVPVPADYDGDGRTDVAVYRPSTGVWYVLESGAQYTTWTQRSWGVATDVPVPGDYDGDGKTDAAIYRPATGVWYTLLSSTNFSTFTSRAWGISTDTPVPGDYDGDGKIDVAIYRPSTGTWYILQSSTNFTTQVSHQWGVSTDIPVPTDYDGDAKADVAIYRPSSGTWYIRFSTTNSTTYASYQWGAETDIPLPKKP